jgi:hypothetical protein
VGGITTAYFLTRPRREDDRPSPPPAFKGWIDVRVWEPNSAERRDLGLRQEGALPLKPKDQIRVVARLNRPGYLYVLWINADGKVQPVYPWRPGHWEDRPAEERPVSKLSLPADQEGGWEMDQGRPGMETLVLLARSTPLPREVDLPQLTAHLPKQSMQNPLAAVWFENGVVVQTDAERAPNFFNVKKINDPVLRTQRLLKTKLGPLCDYSRAVSFAFRGK